MSKQGSSSFVKDSVMTLVRQVASILIGLLTVVIIARVLGPEGQGKYQLIILLPTMLYTFLNFGIEAASVYYVGKKEIELENLYKTSLISSFGLSIIGYIIGLVVIVFYSEELFPGIPKSIMYTIMLVLPFYFSKQFLQAIFQGKRDFKAYNAILLLGQAVILVLTALFLFVFKGNLIHTLFSFVIGHIIAFIVTVYLLKKNYKITLLSGKLSVPFLRKSLNYGVKAHLSNVLTFLNYRADMIIIAFFLNPVAVGLYSIAVSLAERLWIISKSVSTVLFPKIASLDNDNDKNMITSVISRVVMAISILSGIVVYLIADLLIFLLFGSDYEGSVNALKWLLPGIVLGSMERIISNDIAGRGKPEINMYTSIFSVIVNIVLNILLIPHYGINGAAIATSITYTLNWILKIIIFKKISGQPYNTFIFLNKSDIKFLKEYLLKKRKVSGGSK